MHNILRHTPDGQRLRQQGKDEGQREERNRVLALIRQFKVKNKLKADTARNTWKVSGRREDDETRIMFEVMVEEFEKLEQAVSAGHRRIF